MKDFINVVHNRKSIRSFSDKKVSRDLIKKILSIATFAPTNCNQQKWNFVVVDDVTTKERLIKEAASNTIFRRTPVLVAVSYDGWNYKEALQGASLAVGHILLGAEYYDVGALPMNSYGSDKKVKRILNIPKSEILCCFVALGYPNKEAQEASLVPRRPISEAIHFNSFGGGKMHYFDYDPNKWSLRDLSDHQRYYCRKTSLGKEMDIMANSERSLVERELSSVSGSIIDIFSYDGAYLREFLGKDLTTVDLTKETSEYTKKSIELYASDKRGATNLTYEDFLDTDRKFKTVTIIYKLERVSDSIKKEILERSWEILEDDGQLVIISRKSNLLLRIFFFVVKLFFGKELRKTGIYNFFGPYKPIKVETTLDFIKKAGFKRVCWNGYFLFPAFYEQVLQMVIQYVKSDGSSYLHREKRENILTRFVSFIIKLQGFRKFGYLGSVAVIRCKK